MGMTLEQIKVALRQDQTVHWKTELYVVTKADRHGQHHIKCTSNDHCIGLTHQDGVTMNGDEYEFYVPFVIPDEMMGDEQATQDAVVEYIGGTSRMDRLFNLYKNSYAQGTKSQRYYRGREEVFTQRALGAGYNQGEVDALLLLQ